jgi:two-component system, OmpR family, sensor histidine kinase KdpD
VVRVRRIAECAGWVALLALVTGLMVLVRPRLNEAHVALTYLLVILGASARFGRTLGLLLALAAFLLFDWFFLAPYGTLVVANPLDWWVLAAFLTTSMVATHLLDRARAEAETARQRANDVDRLAALGAETLNAGRPEDAVVAVADVIRATIGVDRCTVYTPGATYGSAGTDVAEGLVAWTMEYGAEAAVLSDGTTRAAVAPGRRIVDDHRTRATPALRALLQPLRVRERVVGVLAVERADGLVLDEPRQRILDALSFYAALGVERVKLEADSRHAAALREADALKDAVLASVSHDLRTPLTTIKALAHEMASDASVDDRAATIESEADRLNRFVSDLLDLSRLQAGARATAPGPNEAEDLVGAVLQRVSGAFGGREITVSLDPQHAVLIGRFDFSDALRVLVNLLENAFKYTPASTPIELSVRRDGAWIAFAVSDRGPGIAPEEAGRIFTPFYRPLGATPDASRGAGLGLSIAHSLAAAQDGSLEYAPRPGGGSVFTLRVPLIESLDA